LLIRRWHVASGCTIGIFFEGTETMTKINLSICPTELTHANGDTYDSAALLAAIGQYVLAQYPDAELVCLQIGHRQGHGWCYVDGDGCVGEELLVNFWNQHGSDEDLFLLDEPKKWTASDCTDASYLGGIELTDIPFESRGHAEQFDVMRLDDRLVFGSGCNAGFLESGYIIRDGEDETDDDLLTELLADLETYYVAGADYVSRIVVNDRM
jgi:hypothetical protein